ncbi:MAG: hypothetical protein QOI78_1697 [Actinomycetota bacterium]|jgi:hypothetical protein|nr:hypothetical protein [Actinomycetota bacterium]
MVCSFATLTEITDRNARQFAGADGLRRGPIGEAVACTEWL